MNKRNEIKVFVPGSQKADYTIFCFKPETGAKALEKELSVDAANKVRSAFRYLKRAGGSSLTTVADGRRIKVALAA